MSRVRVPAAESACSEMIEKGCEFERVGAGAVPHEARASKPNATIALLIIFFSR
jgi:hypothetical protein